jgi:hypothetical protein
MPRSVSIRRPARRGVTATQVAVVLALIFLAVFAGAQLLGDRTNVKMGQTASDLSDVSKLPARFGS